MSSRQLSTCGPSRDGTYESIQALRGVAAVLVTLFHASEHAYHSDQVFRIGNAGVDIFFVISGFVMWTVTARRPPSAATFLHHRLVRLVPLYYFFSLALLAAWLVLPSAFPNMAPPTASHVLLSLAFLPHADPSGHFFPLLAQGWTLNYEMFFYLLFALGLMLPSDRRFASLAALLAILPAVGLLPPEAWLQSAPALGLLSPLLIEFLGGVAIARWAEGGRRPAKIWLWAALALGSALLLLLPNPPADDDWLRLALFGLPAFLIVAGAVGLELTTQHFVLGRTPSLLGASSYSLYLSHTFVISLAGKILASAPPWIFVGVATMASLGIAMLVYLLLEKPLLSLMRGKRRIVGRPLIFRLIERMNFAK